MKDNKEILNEAFFKKDKDTHYDKLLASMPQYAAVNSKGEAVYNVNDTAEMKKRLAGTFGVTFGNNSIRSLASKAVKTFPILISDNVEVETAVILKKLMEEQYAEYINLLVSNQVIDLGAYQSSENGNIAIQALDNLSGTDFSKSRVANTAAATGDIKADDLFKNIPLYQLLRENKEVKVGDPTMDALLENALIVDEKDVAKVAEYMCSHVEELMEATAVRMPDLKHATVSGRNTTLADYMEHSGLSDTAKGELAIKSAADIHTTDPDYLTTADIVVDPSKMDKAINRTVGAFLLDKENAAIRDKFEKATFLLQSRRIAGVEYYSYLTLRLGIPVSDKARKSLVVNFKIKDIRDEQGLSRTEGGYRITADDVYNIGRNRRLVDPIVNNICSHRWRDFLVAAGSTAAGAGIGAAIGGALTAAGTANFWNPLGWVLLASGAVVGIAGGIAAVAALRRRDRRLALDHQPGATIEGWERVEALVNSMSQMQDSILNPIQKTSKAAVDGDNTRDLKSIYTPTGNTSAPYVDDHSLEQAYATVQTMIAKNLREEYEPDESLAKDTFNESVKDLTKEYNSFLTEDFMPIYKEALQDEEVQAELLQEGFIFGRKKTIANTTMPIKTRYVESKPGKEIVATPAFMARSSYAYGSTEIERKENKDRKYNQPLIMTVKFRERFSDGKYSDNELTAVIGILGKIIRIPSNEMEYILKTNAEGGTVEGFFKNSKGDLGNMISDMIADAKVSAESKELKHSADVWKNLEKVSALAAANTMAGRKSNNIANAHIVFAQKEIDDIRNDIGVDYLKDVKYASSLMKKYSAFTLMVANDAGQRVYIMDDKDNISWDAVPYSAIRGKEGGESLDAALAKLARL